MLLCSRQLLASMPYLELFYISRKSRLGPPHEKLRLLANTHFCTTPWLPCRLLLHCHAHLNPDSRLFPEMYITILLSFFRPLNSCIYLVCDMMRRCSQLFNQLHFGLDGALLTWNPIYIKCNKFSINLALNTQQQAVTFFTPRLH